MPDKIKGLIAGLAPEPICDDCIVERLGLTAPHQASQRTRELAGKGGFERRKDQCAICGDDKTCTRRNRI